MMWCFTTDQAYRSDQGYQSFYWEVDYLKCDVMALITGQNLMDHQKLARDAPSFYCITEYTALVIRAHIIEIEM